MHRIATPISTLFGESKIAQLLAAASDCLECRDASVASNLPKQELFHFEADLGHPWREGEKAFIKDAIAQKLELHVITFHLASCCSDPQLEGQIYQLGGDLYSRDDIRLSVSENIQWLRSFVPESIVIGLENNNYYPTPAYEHVTDGDLLSVLVSENGLSFLLDIAHAHVTAHNRSLPLEDYLASLPLHHTIQMHIAQSDIDQKGLAFDAHNEPTEETWIEVGQLLRKLPTVQYLTIEYYRDAEVLLKLIQSCRTLLK